MTATLHRCRVGCRVRVRVEQAVARGLPPDRIAEREELDLDLVYRHVADMEQRQYGDAFWPVEREVLLEELEHERHRVRARVQRPSDLSDLWPHIRLVMACNLLNWEAR